MSTDVQITGSMGLYAIQPLTANGTIWIAKNCSSGRRTWQSGALMCESGDRCRDIVRAMDRDGLSVTVNGTDMAGFSRKAAS
jgi:hypothetical protein